MQKNFSSHSLPVIGVDVGGTKISAGWVENNRLVKSHTIPTPVSGDEKAVLQAIIKSIKSLEVPEYMGIGIGIPGLADTRNGIVYDVQNIPALSGMALRDKLEETFRRPVEINNDANCFVLGVKNHEDGRPFTNLVGLTLGTGLGGGLILNGELYEGTGTGAGEIGFIPYEDATLEEYCSGQFFQKHFGISGGEAYNLALNQEEKALEMFTQFGHHIGEAVKIIAHLLAPEALFFGGSISQAFWLFEKSMWESIRHFPYAHVIDNLQIMPATSPDLAMVGAASLISKKLVPKP